MTRRRKETIRAGEREIWCPSAEVEFRFCSHASHFRSVILRLQDHRKLLQWTFNGKPTRLSLCKQSAPFETRAADHYLVPELHRRADRLSYFSCESGGSGGIPTRISTATGFPSRKGALNFQRLNASFAASSIAGTNP